jgi:hypothetical protein
VPVSFEAADAIELRLDDVDELFVARAPDARAGRGGAESGIERLEARLALKPATAEWPDILRIHLPSGLGGADPDKVREAFARWCELELERIDTRRTLMARERGRAWVVGAAFFAACLLLAGLLESVPFLSGFVASLLSETIIIAGWVGIWHPLDLTLYAWWPDARRRKLLERMRALKLEFPAT